MTSLKWWISASIEVASSCGGSAYLRLSETYGPSGSPSSACSMIFTDSRISAIRTR